MNIKYYLFFLPLVQSLASLHDWKTGYAQIQNSFPIYLGAGKHTEGVVVVADLKRIKSKIYTNVI